jgi:hypothetical protein
MTRLREKAAQIKEFTSRDIDSLLSLLEFDAGLWDR